MTAMVGELHAHVASLHPRAVRLSSRRSPNEAAFDAVSTAAALGAMRSSSFEEAAAAAGTLA